MTAAFLKWTQRVLFAGAFLALGYCAFVLTDSWMFQHTENAELDRLRPADDPAAQVTTPDSTRPATQLPGMVGRIEVKRLGLSVVVVEGTDTASLARAAGHIAGTSLPGEHGNVGIAAHRVGPERITTVSKPHLLRLLSLLIERKADSPTC